MFEFHGWVNILPDDTDDADIAVLRERKRVLTDELEQKAKEIDWGGDVFTIHRSLNGQDHLVVTGFANHRQTKVIELFRWIASRQPYSYGLLHIRDDAGSTGGHENDFRVYAVTRGKVKETTEPLLSPCAPTIAAPTRGAQPKHAAPEQPPDPTWPGLSWRFLVRDWRYPGREVYHLESDGRTWFDELVVGDWLHIEWMSGRRWWMQLGDAMINVTIPKGQPPVIEVERDIYYDRPSAEDEIRNLEQGDIEADPYGPDADDE